MFSPSHHLPAVHQWLFLIAAIGLNPSVFGQVAAQTERPSGALSNKIVFVSAGHGWTADNLSNGAWETQRGETFELVEDLNNGDILTFQVDALWRAGATIVPLRPVGQQPNEIVLDNDDPEVEFIGPWFISTSPQFFGSPGDTPYRYAETVSTETAVARYRPTFVEDGGYPVYTWVRHANDRVEQLYRVVHSGGSTEVSVDHRRVGTGLVYLGTYHFKHGNGGYVEISNENSEGGVVVADMIRFGNGLGDTDRGGGISGYPRADEAALYWIETHAGQGTPSTVWRSSTSDRTATVSAPPRWAAHMNRELAGAATDRVYVGHHHSNAGGGAGRGVLGLYNGNNNPSTATPNQYALALAIAQELNDDMVSLNGSFEHSWHDRGTSLTLDRSDIEFGEINNNYINDEFDATIIERGFHDNQLDAELLRDMRVCEAIARATTQGVVRFLNAFDPVGVPLSFSAATVETVRAEANADGTMTVTWQVPSSGPALGDPATGFLVQSSGNGYGFDNGVLVVGGAATSLTLPATGADPLYFRVVAVNTGGHSPPSPVVACRPASGARVLIVNGFDRMHRTLNIRGPYLAGSIDRVFPEHQNSRDYAVPVASAASAFDDSIQIDCAQNENVIAGDVALNDYDVVVWILGEESGADVTLDSVEQSHIAGFLSGGGNLMISGAEIAWDLDQTGSTLDQLFINNELVTAYVSDDANTYDVQGASGSVFSGLAFGFDDGTVYYDSQFPDVLAPLGSATAAMSYVGGSGGTAAIQRAPDAGLGALVVMGFPFETIIGQNNRETVMAAFLGLAGITPTTCHADLTTQGAGLGDPDYGEPDGLVTGADISYYVNAWVVHDLLVADLTTTGAGIGDPGYGVPDGQVTGADIQYYVNLWVAGCP